MCGLLLFLIVGLPVAELWLLIEVGSRIGSFEVIFLVFATAALGLHAVRGQSVRTVGRLRAAAAQAELEGSPGDAALAAQAALLEGPLLALAALMLLVPGFITDAGGLLLLVPPLRRAVARRWVRRKAVRPGSGTGGNTGAATANPGIIVLSSWDVRTQGPARPPREPGTEPTDEPGGEPPRAPGAR